MEAPVFEKGYPSYEAVNGYKPEGKKYDQGKPDYSLVPYASLDEVVKVLSTSYEALADFAELRTQADVDAFNSRYGVSLVLPQEA